MESGSFEESIVKAVSLVKKSLSPETKISLFFKKVTFSFKTKSDKKSVSATSRKSVWLFFNWVVYLDWLCADKAAGCISLLERVQNFPDLFVI